MNHWWTRFHEPTLTSRANSNQKLTRAAKTAETFKNKLSLPDPKPSLKHLDTCGPFQTRPSIKALTRAAKTSETPRQR